jgi:hypothetical protein
MTCVDETSRANAALPKDNQRADLLFCGWGRQCPGTRDSLTSARMAWSSRRVKL